MTGTWILNVCFVLTILQAAMCTEKAGVAPDCRDFFAKSINGNLTKITWAHAVNSRELLAQALGNDKIMMLEADVVMGIPNDGNVNNTEMPIMAHSAGDPTDLTLEEFLTSVIGDGKRGMKLDFKSDEAFVGSRKILENFRANITVPFWLNADIIAGPVDAAPTEPKPVGPRVFMDGAGESFPESTLSVGWTTRYGEKVNVTSGNYTREHINAMIAEVGRMKTKQSITYPIRAGLAAHGAAIFTDLLKETAAHKPTLTIWSSANDTVDHVALSKFIKDIGVDRVYVDVPEDLLSKLQISDARSLTGSAVMLLTSLVASVAITKILYH